MDQTIQNVLRDSRFYKMLLGFDPKIADAANASQGQKCEAKLHWGSFARKPRGVPVGLGPEHLQRFSLCWNLSKAWVFYDSWTWIGDRWLNFIRAATEWIR